MKIYRLFSAILLCCLFIGCSEFDIPQVKDILKDPAGEAGLKRGMTQSEVISIYREPNAKRMVVSKDWNGAREEWFYKADLSAMPVGAGYLSDDLYLYFDGDNLTNINRQPLGVSENITGDKK